MASDYLCIEMFYFSFIHIILLDNLNTHGQVCKQEHDTNKQNNPKTRLTLLYLILLPNFQIKMLIEDANQNNFSAFVYPKVGVCIHLISHLSNNWNWLRFINGSGLLTSIGGLYSSKVGFVRRYSALFGDYR